MKLITASSSVFLLMVITIGAVNLPIASAQVTKCDVTLDGKTNDELEAMLKECEAEIAQNREELKGIQREATTIEQGIDELNYKIKQSELEIKRRSIKIYQLEDEINAKRGEIGIFNNQISRIKDSLAEIVREANELDTRSAVEAVLSVSDISEFFVDVDALGTIKGKILQRITDIRNLKVKAEEAQNAFEDAQSREQTQKFTREKEKRQTENFRGEKQQILSITKAQEKTYKQIIAEKEAKKNAVLSRILNIGAIEITFGDALKIAQPYGDTLGVDPALTLAILTQETGVEGVIGKNLGKCTYNQPASNSAGTVMSNSQKPTFLAITQELGLDAEKTPVSCPIVSDGAYGGALGPSQFMPLTWNAFKSRVAEMVGVSLVSPFNNRDAFVGTMLYLSDGQKKCATSFSSQYDIWRCAAAKYYSGLASTGSRLARHMNGYGTTVANRALQFQKDIEFLSL